MKKHEILKCYLISLKDEISKIEQAYKEIMQSELCTHTAFSTYSDFILQHYKERDGHPYGFIKIFSIGNESSKVRVGVVAGIYILKDKHESFGIISADVSKDFVLIDVRPNEYLLERYKYYLMGYRKMLEMHIKRLEKLIQESVTLLIASLEKISESEVESCLPFSEFVINP